MKGSLLPPPTVRRPQLQQLHLTRYSNRLLYSRLLHRYIVNLRELHQFWSDGVVITVTDNVTKQDITAAILMKMLADEVEAGRATVDAERLRDLVRGERP